MCVHVRAVCMCSESMNNITDNAKNNFGDPLDTMYIACARSVSENVGFVLKNLYIVSDNFDLCVVSWQCLFPR